MGKKAENFLCLNDYLQGAAFLLRKTEGFETCEKQGDRACFTGPGGSLQGQGM